MNRQALTGATSPLRYPARAAEWFSSPVGGSHIQRVNAYQFYRLATLLAPLKREFGDPVALGDIAGELLVARHDFDQFIKSWSLGTALAAAHGLIANIGALIEKGNPKEATAEGQAWDWSVKVQPWELAALATAVSRFETVLAEETAIASTYLVEQKSIFSTADLMERAENAFEKAVRDAMPADATTDFKAAGRCLAFDLYTASGFHTVRCLEAVVGDYHDAFTKKPLAEKNRTLGGYHQSLEGSNAPGELVRVLGHIKDTYRNAVIHATGWRLTEGEATSLFHVSQSAITSFVTARLALPK